MSTEKQQRLAVTILKCAALGIVLISASACVVDPYPPPAPHAGYYSDGYYSYYDYPYDYHYYGDYPSAYSGDYDAFRARRDADERNGLGHSDDRNFHNRDDYDHYDR